MIDEVVKKEIRDLAEGYAKFLKEKLLSRKEEMYGDDVSHYLIYRILGVSENECWNIDYYQNAGRFIYRYAGEFLEKAACICLNKKYPNGRKVRISNPFGFHPRTYEIDFLNDSDAIEIKWRDATTDGDHIAKEHARAKAIREAGYLPIRVMFYYPQRRQAQRIQEALVDMYKGLEGLYYFGDDAWQFLKEYTGVDLKLILVELDKEKNENKH